jgi:hypothetical protein
MKFRTLSFVIVFVLVVGILLTSISTPASAQGEVPTPTSANPSPEATPLPGIGTISFYQLIASDIQMVGPYDIAPLVFGLPADWKITGLSELKLDLNVAVNTMSGVSIDGNVVTGAGGTLKVEYNREVIGLFPLNQSGEISVQMQIPLAFMNSVREDKRQELVFVLDSGASCLINQHVTVNIRTSSSMTFPHENVPPDTNLARFPFPIYQDSIYQDTALIVLPDKPSAEELQSAMTLSAGLGRMSGSKIALDMTLAGQLTPEQVAANNVILVGKADSLPLLDQLQFPISPVSGKFHPQGGDVDDGIVQMAQSPWAPGRVILLISGNTDEAVLKASQAVSTGVLRANAAANVSVIREVQNVGAQGLPKGNDLTLLDMGYANTLLQRRGVDTAIYRFYVPLGLTVSPEAYFELVYGNSALLDYGRSGLVVQINGQPVGSVRFSDSTASKAINRIRINIPSSVVVSGPNTLEVISNLEPIDNCSIPNLRGLWATVWGESRFHLPFTQALVETNLAFGLAQFPAPFVFDPSLSTTAFVLQRDDPESWRSALQVASYLGDYSNGSVILLKTFYADAVPDSARANLHMIVLGLVPQLPIVAELNDHLPAPFESETGIASERNMLVTFRIPPDSPVGYVELLPSPWNDRNAIILAVGNLRQGADWASATLHVSGLRSRLAGNFAVVNDQQVTTTDTRISLPAGSVAPTAQPNVEVVPPGPVNAIPLAESRPTWILPALFVTLGVMVIILFGVFYNASAKNRRRGRVIPPSARDGNNKP